MSHQMTFCRRCNRFRLTQLLAGTYGSWHRVAERLTPTRSVVAFLNRRSDVRVIPGAP